MFEVAARRSQGAPCWVSLLVRDLPAAQEFYGGLLGWEFRPGPTHFGRYVRAVRDGRLVAGIGEGPMRAGAPLEWTTYLSTEDADGAAAAIQACGGTVAVGPLAADRGAGRLAIAADPSGAPFGVWQADRFAGVEAVGVPGALAWNELVTPDVAVAAFYAEVFGLEADAPVPSGDGSAADTGHVTLRAAGEPVAGVHGTGRAALGSHEPRWTTYFEVDDARAAAVRVVELGGRVLREPYEIKYGQVAEVADPEGAAFLLFSEPR